MAATEREIVLKESRKSLWKDLTSNYFGKVPSSESRKIDPPLSLVKYPSVLPFLYSPVFNIFLEGLSNAPFEMKDKEAVEKFCSASLCTDEVSTMNSIVTNAVKDLLGDASVSSLAIDDRKTKPQTDVTVSCKYAEDVFMLINFELKTQTAQGDPLRQNILYYILHYLQKYNPKPPTDTLPALLVSVRGRSVAVHGIAILEKSVEVVELAFVEMLGSTSRTYNQQLRLFAGLRKATNYLKEYYSNNKQEKKYIDAISPYKQDFIYKNERCCIKYIEHVERLVYRAIVTEGHADLKDKIVIVKFAYTYSKECHNLFYELRVSPELFFCEKISHQDSHFMIVMEDLGDAQLLCYVLSKLNIKLRAACKNILEQAVSKVHSLGYVHGDIRSTNIIIRDNSPMLIDFDWAGKIGEARYPINMNFGAKQWAESAVPGGLITQDHDNWLVQDVFKVDDASDVSKEMEDLKL